MGIAVVAARFQAHPTIPTCANEGRDLPPHSAENPHHERPREDRYHSQQQGDCGDAGHLPRTQAEAHHEAQQAGGDRQPDERHHHGEQCCLGVDSAAAANGGAEEHPGGNEHRIHWGQGSGVGISVGLGSW